MSSKFKACSKLVKTANLLQSVDKKSNEPDKTKHVGWKQPKKISKEEQKRLDNLNAERELKKELLEEVYSSNSARVIFVYKIL